MLHLPATPMPGLPHGRGLPWHMLLLLHAGTHSLMHGNPWFPPTLLGALLTKPDFSRPRGLVEAIAGSAFVGWDIWIMVEAQMPAACYTWLRTVEAYVMHDQLGIASRHANADAQTLVEPGHCWGISTESRQLAVHMDTGMRYMPCGMECAIDRNCSATDDMLVHTKATRMLYTFSKEFNNNRHKKLPVGCTLEWALSHILVKNECVASSTMTNECSWSSTPCDHE